MLASKSEDVEEPSDSTDEEGDTEDQEECADGAKSLMPENSHRCLKETRSQVTPRPSKNPTKVPEGTNDALAMALSVQKETLEMLAGMKELYAEIKVIFCCCFKNV